MEVKFLKEPFPHIIVKDYFTEQELSDIWVELQFLSTNNKLLSPEETGSAWKGDGSGGKILIKNNYGVWLDNIYTNRKISDILTHSRKLFSPKLITEVVNYDWMFKYLKYSTNDTTLLSYYENGGYYAAHHDNCALTAITHLYKEPKCFDGGELSFPDFEYNYGLENNRMILFPSILDHEVSEVVMHNDVKFGGRYTISQFLKLG